MTYTSVWDQIKQVVRNHEDRRLNFVSYLTQEATLAAILDLDVYSLEQVAVGQRGFRSVMSAVLEADTMAGLLAGFVLQIASVIGAPERSTGDARSCLRPLIRYMVDNPASLTPVSRIRSRQFTRGAWSPTGGNAGDGTFYRLFVTEDGLPFENTLADVITLECTLDRQFGTVVGREQFKISGRALADNIELYQSGKGSGLTKAFNCVSSDDSRALLTNPSFGDGGANAAPTTIPGWTVGAIANFEVVQGAGLYYRTSDGDATGSALKIKASDTISQKLSTNRRSLTRGRPYWRQIAFNAEAGTATGSLVFAVGTKTVTVTLDGLTGWRILRFPVDKDCWPANFTEDDLELSIQFVRTAGYVLVDDVVFCEWPEAEPDGRFDNQWIIGVSAATPFEIGDTGTFTDSEEGAIIQRKFHLGFGVSLPAVPPAPTGNHAVALAGVGAGNVDNGAHRYMVTFRRQISESDYSESGGNTFQSVTVVDKTTNGKVAVSAIPTGPTGTYSRRLWRTKVGDTATYYLLTEVAGNVTTTYTDNTADASLAVTTIPGGITIDDPA